jgi:hypothetical protein
MKNPLKHFEITGAPDALAAVRSALGDLLSVTNAATARLSEGVIEGGRFKVEATL